MGFSFLLGIECTSFFTKKYIIYTLKLGIMISPAEVLLLLLWRHYSYESDTLVCKKMINNVGIKFKFKSLMKNYYLYEKLDPK